MSIDCIKTTFALVMNIISCVFFFSMRFCSKNIHVQHVVLSSDSYLLTTEKNPFCFFRRVSLILSLLSILARFPLCECVCVCPLFYFLLRETRERTLLTCSLARLCCFSLSLFPPSYHHTSRRLLLLLTLIIEIFCFVFG